MSHNRRTTPVFPLTCAMLDTTHLAPPASLGYISTATIVKLEGSVLANQVSVASVSPSGSGNNALYVVNRVFGTLLQIKSIEISFPFRAMGWKDLSPPGLNWSQPATKLRHAKIYSGSFGAMAVLINHAPALEHLTLNFCTMAGAAETDRMVSAEALRHMRRLVLERIDQLVEPKVVSQILLPAGGTLWSLSISTSMRTLFETLRQRENYNFADALVHLALMVNYPSQGFNTGVCTHNLEERKDETLQACNLIQACPRLAHLSLQGFHARDLVKILVTVKRPLISLAIQGYSCNNKIASTVIRPMFEEGHRVVSRLRVLALHRDPIDPDWRPVSALCKRQRTAIRLYGDLLSLMACRGVSKFCKLIQRLD